MKSIFYLLLSAFLILAGCRSDSKTDTYNADVIVYGGTSAAVTTAVQVSRMGKSVIIVSPDIHLGGLSSSGLGYTDTGNKEVIGGLAREFYQLLYQHYMKPEAWKWQKQSEYGNKGQGNPAIDGDLRTMWIFEPHTAEEAFEKMIKDNNITVLRDEWLDRNSGVKKDQGKIMSFKTLSGKIFIGKFFVDATYEGDLMASAGISYHTGREAGSVYNEEWNGVQVGDFPIKHHDFDNLNIDPYVVPGNASSGVLPLISTKDPGNRGEGDNRIQAYCFRTCLTKNEENRVQFTKPSGYDSTQYELLIRIYEAGWRGTFNKFDAIPNAKTDVNNHGPFSFDNIGMNYDYPEASYERRKEIIDEHIKYQKGLLYFIANDTRVPEEVRNEMKQWGYAKDEFTENGNWPYNIYVREARRMKGEYIMTENDVLSKRLVNHSIGMGSYNLDSHNAQRYIKPDGFVENEGDIELPTGKPYMIDLGSIMPKREECLNLLVPVCVSSSHIAFGSIRMEPVFMILGQSAGTVAAMALDKNKIMYDLTYDEIKSKLESDGQILCNAQQTILKVWPEGIPGSIINESYFEQSTTSASGITGFQRVTDPTITVFLPPAEKSTGTAVLICPGGGYGMLAFDHEGFQIARWLNDNGIAGIILKYRLPSDLIMKDKRIGPLQDAQEAMRIIRRNSKEWKINPQKIGVIGFSAGGHLASTLSTHYDEIVYEVKDKITARPDFSILIYPVVSFDASFGHSGTRRNLIGENPSDTDVRRFSNELQINEKTPPAFLVHSADDNAVPVRNSIVYFENLIRYKIPAELHIFEKGGHGYGLSVGNGTQSSWPVLCIDWLKSNSF